MYNFNAQQVTVEDIKARNPEASSGSAQYVYDLTLRGYSEIPSFYPTTDRDEEDGVWVGVVHTSTYGADANSEIMIDTNAAAATDMLDLHEVTWTYCRGEVVALVCDAEGVINETAIGICEEIRESLEDYHLLDEDAYSEACNELAMENMPDAISDAVRDVVDDDMEEELEELGLDAEDIVDAALAENAIEWWEEECWPSFQGTGVVDAITEAIRERREQHALGASMASTCNRTLDLFEDNA